MSSSKKSDIGTQPGRARQGALAFAFALLVLSPARASADMANGVVEFLQNVNILFDTANFPTANFATANSGKSGGGFLWSMTSHGPTDDENFPTASPFLQSSTSTGDTELSHNRVSYSASAGAGFPSIIRIDGSNQTNSDSEAASSQGMAHDSDSYAYTTVFQILDVTRNPGSGIVDSPVFGVEVVVPANAIHLRAITENGSALASAYLSLVGRVKNLNLADPTFEDLTTKDLMGNSITANNEWYSAALGETDHLNLPDWTRLSGAHFELDLGLRLSMHTSAHVVPEPCGIVALLAGSLRLASRRRRRAK